MEATNAAMPPSPTAVAPETVQAPEAIQAPEAQPEASKTAEQERIESQIIALTRKEREIQRQMQEFKKERAEYEKMQAELNEYRGLREKASVDPLAITKHFGIEYKKLTDQLLNNENPTPEMLIANLQAKLEKLEQEKIAEKEAAESQTREQAIQSFKDRIVKTIDSNPEKYELLQTFGAYDQVLSTVYNHYQQTGEIIPIEQVAEYLESQMESEARKLLSLKKLSPKEEAQVKEALENKAEASLMPKQPSKTLTNTMASEGSNPASKPFLSREESIREAAKLIRFS